MEDNEAVVKSIIARDDPDELRPVLWNHIAGVDRRGELIDIHIHIFADEIKFRHGVLEVIEIQRFQGPRERVLTHADGAACVNQQYFIHILKLISSCRISLNGDTDAD